MELSVKLFVVLIRFHVDFFHFWVIRYNKKYSFINFFLLSFISFEKTIALFSKKALDLTKIKETFKVKVALSSRIHVKMFKCFI